MDVLDRLLNFNLIKYTGQYVLTIDKGHGDPIIFQNTDLGLLLKDVADYLERIGK